MPKKTKKKVILSAVLVILSLLIVWIVWGNTALQLTECTFSNDKIPFELDGFRIAQISDLHNTEIGDGNEKLLKMIRDAEPDIIVLTGDIIDSRRTDIDTALAFTKEAIKIAPCYYITGNHESRAEEYETLKNGLISQGITVLENETVYIKKGEATIRIIGLNDPFFSTDTESHSSVIMKNTLSSLNITDDYFTLLLSHRPELFDIYKEYEIDLVLSGHAHGGQFRIPFLGGVFVPSQGLFPKYDAGLFTENGTSMIISRGIGNSVFPFRINNRPEVVLIELKKSH